MILFFLKKTLVDGWDNLLRIILCNVFFSVLAIAFYYVASSFVTNELSAIVSIAVGIVLFTVPIFMINESMACLSHSKTMPLKEMLKTFTAVWKDALLFSALLLLLFFLIAVGIPFYLSLGNILGIFLSALIFWAVAITILSLQWFLAVRAQLKNAFFKSLKKSFILFFDNAVFSVFMFAYSLFLMAVSVLLAFFAPGISGLLLAQNNAFRLRMYKYDWLEEQTEESMSTLRRNIPWDDLLSADKEALGPLSIKTLIFPWK